MFRRGFPSALAARELKNSTVIFIGGSVMYETLRWAGRTVWLVLVLSISGVSVATPIFGISPALTDTTVGGFFDVTIDITTVTDLYAYQFDLDFDPLVLSAVSIDEGQFLLSGGTTFFLPGLIDNALGLISFTANSLIGALPGVSGDGSLALVRFLAISPGSSSINLSGVALLDSSLTDIASSTAGGRVVVSAVVPEPGSALLAALGLLAMIGARCGRRSYT